MAVKNSHCSYCGTAFASDAPWPRRCATCGNTTYLNPLPVAVLLVPFSEGLLLVERADRIGKYALPGGYINAGESWQVAGAREVCEETGVIVAPEQVQLFDGKSAPDGTLLIFGLVSPVLSTLPDSSVLSPPDPTEVVAIRTVTADVLREGDIPFAFSLHQEVALRWANERRG